MTENITNPMYQVYCNRTLNMKGIRAVGFDMDYTLALYKPETFETLAYKETLKKLVSLGYPTEILSWKFNWNEMIRGLAIDKQRGNVIKMDRHRYVKKAFHGFQELHRDVRNGIYNSEPKLTYEEPDFSMVDTLFTLADAYLFSQLVQLGELKPGCIQKPFFEVYKDVRNAIDLCHRDGSIKKKVAENPEQYIQKDPHFMETLMRLKDSGRKLFIATNSLWDYTNVVMNYLFHNNSQVLNHSWLDMFDIVITGCAKPSFFMSSNPLFEVDLNSGLLRNTEGILPNAKVFHGGNVQHLHTMLKIKNGADVLYIGDHIYGDILRSKKDLGWRTMLVITELEKEVSDLAQFANEHKNFEELLGAKDTIDEEIQRVKVLIKQLKNSQTPEILAQHEETLKNLEEKRLKTKEMLQLKLKNYHEKFHPVWGELMKTGYQNSRFAAQVENYACLYTSKFTNLRHYSPNRTFRSTRDYMPHDLPF
jgi:HAD superfamily 5'-nucleotidase-like hydrolase